MTRQQFIENARMGLDALRSHILRSILTVLAVIIGIWMVVSMASMLTGMRSNILDQFEKLGTENIYALHFGAFGIPSREEFQRPPLELSYVDDLMEQSEYIAGAAYQGLIFGPSPVIKHREEMFRNAILRGASSNFAENIAVQLSEGRFFSQVEDHRRRKVCVLGINTVEALFQDQLEVVGKKVQIGDDKFTVVGILEKSKTTFLGQSGEDNLIFIPYGTFRKLYPQADPLMIVIQARRGYLAEALDESETILRRSRGLKSDEDSNFNLSTLDTLVEQFDSIGGAIGGVLFFISVIALLVGGVGVMNIMLVSVKERTREIGIRKALGALRRDITLQFLFEAVILTAVGGILGILAAIATGLALLLLFDLPGTIPIWAMLAGIGLAMAVGLAAGVFPAFRASRLDPIECLRYE